MKTKHKKQRILTVDDDPMIRNLTRAIFEAEDFEVLSAQDGYDAIKMLQEEKRPIELSCIVLDVQMPGITGVDLLTRLKLHADTQNIPVLMLTCQSSPEDVVTGYNVGAEYYITKPFTREQLLYGVRMVLS